ncbi:MAG: carbamoyl phosphate synthase large subunit, partial [Desulfobulbaceae bacterium]|nr:carbamoyl phosphate synthase large subunit [Desulfobulbaceae bacterium]
DKSLGLAFAKSQFAAGQSIPREGTVLFSMRGDDKKTILPVAKQLTELGFSIMGTRGTAKYLNENGVECTQINKISEGRPHILDKIQDKEIQWIVNTSRGTRTTEDSYTIRRAALDYHLPYTTTVAGAESMAMAIATLKNQPMEVKSLQEYFE